MIAIKGYDHLPSTCAICPFMLFDDRTDEPYCPLEAVADIQLKIEDFDVKRHENCPLREVDTLKWNHVITKEDAAWCEQCPEIFYQSLKCQAGNAFVRNLLNEEKDIHVEKDENFLLPGMEHPMTEYQYRMHVIKE